MAFLVLYHLPFAHLPRNFDEFAPALVHVCGTVGLGTKSKEVEKTIWLTLVVMMILAHFS